MKALKAVTAKKTNHSSELWIKMKKLRILLTYGKNLFSKQEQLTMFLLFGMICQGKYTSMEFLTIWKTLRKKKRLLLIL